MNDAETKKTLAPDYFEAVYQGSDDPWNFATSDYEARKYAATLDALPREKYASAFEIGCSIGVLTAQLAKRCGQLLAIDVNDAALAQARERCREFSHVSLAKMFVPEEFPAKNFDLIVVSEVGYYLSAPDWERAQNEIVNHLNPQGDVVLVHWTHFVHDYPQTGDVVHDSFANRAKGRLNLLKAVRTADYRLDVWRKADKF